MEDAILMSDYRFRVAREYAIRKERLGLTSTIIGLYTYLSWFTTQGFTFFSPF